MFCKDDRLVEQERLPSLCLFFDVPVSTTFRSMDNDCHFESITEHMFSGRYCWLQLHSPVAEYRPITDDTRSGKEMLLKRTPESSALSPSIRNINASSLPKSPNTALKFQTRTFGATVNSPRSEEISTTRVLDAENNQEAGTRFALWSYEIAGGQWTGRAWRHSGVGVPVSTVAVERTMTALVRTNPYRLLWPGKHGPHADVTYTYTTATITTRMCVQTFALPGQAPPPGHVSPFSDYPGQPPSRNQQEGQSSVNVMSPPTPILHSVFVQPV